MSTHLVWSRAHDLCLQHILKTINNFCPYSGHLSVSNLDENKMKIENM